MRNILLVLLALTSLSCSRLSVRSEGSAPAAGGATTSATPAKTSTPAAPGASPYVPRGTDYGTAPEIIAFGSCANQDAPQPIWKSVIASEPDLFLMMGDNVYASKPEQQPIAEQYRKLDQVPEYREAREKIPFMAIWDDHDMGTNDGGGDSPTRLVAQRDFLNYWTYVKNSMPVNQDGLYHAKLMGGLVTGRRRKVSKGPILQVIMLDTRSFRSALKRAENPRSPLHKFDPHTDRSTTLLGSAQWEWLEEQLRKKADLRIIVSSIQMIADDHGFEKWGNFPHEKQRFFDLLKRTKAHNVIVLSGDRHVGSIAKQTIPGWGVLYDITASSLNKPTDLSENDATYLKPAYNKENFGWMKIDWKRQRAQVELRDLNGNVFNSAEVKF